MKKLNMILKTDFSVKAEEAKKEVTEIKQDRRLTQSTIQTKTNNTVIELEKKPICIKNRYKPRKGFFTTLGKGLLKRNNLFQKINAQKTKKHNLTMSIN